MLLSAISTKTAMLKVDNFCWCWSFRSTVNITDEELRKTPTGVWERRQLLNSVPPKTETREEDATAPAVGE
ncbi:MAG: hypothetical protein A3F70_09125 [Acidobacteria bacterium RIFCSPLOWO2_12_FULL_67_14]|nr:MAG: hypothetical protein A3F70_09125 [Acidobacteria bacterium RIFCSPLOWO2_12_FULL_67_14]